MPYFSEDGTGWPVGPWWAHPAHAAVVVPLLNVLDNFDRDDGPLASPWVIWQGSFATSSDVLACTSTADGDTAAYPVGQSDMMVEGTFANIATPGFGLIARATDIDNCYLLNVNPVSSVWETYKRNAGTWTLLKSVTADTVTTGDTFRLLVCGSAVIAYHNDVPLYAFNDTAVTVGSNAGVRAANTGDGTTPPPGELDNFRVRDPALMLYIYGHSIATGSGASDTAHRWSTLAATDLGLVEDNRAVSGATVKAIGEDVTSANTHSTRWLTTQYGAAVAIMSAANTERLFGASAEPSSVYYTRAMCSFVRSGQLISWPSFTLSAGTWATNTYLPGIYVTNRASTVQGAYYEVEFTGDNVTVYSFVSTGASLQLEYQIDGAVVDTITYDPSVIVTSSSDNDAGNDQICERFAGLGAGTHTLRVTNLASGGGILYADSITVDADDPTTVLLVAENYSGDYSTGANVAPYNNSSDAIVDAYNAILDSVAAEYTDGKVKVVRVTDWDTAVDVSSDEVHPTDSGHAKIAASVVAALGG